LTEITFREPTIDDANSMLSLVRDCKPLDENSPYLYALLCNQFSKTCVVAESDSKIIAFLSAFVSPKNPDTLFVWQVAVDEAYRNKGIAQKLVSESLSQAGPSIHYVSATVTPSNKASLKFLQTFANHLNTNFTKQPLFSAKVLGDVHEPEDLVRIGPVPQQVEEVVA
jgi:L-2,4-diaminobutyric acid acetyltransferase